jgi:hypothetical protein
MGLPLKFTILSVLIYTIIIILLFRYDPTGHFKLGNATSVSITIFGAIVLGTLLFMGMKKKIMYGFQATQLTGHNLWEITKVFGMIVIGLAIFLGFVTLIFTFMKDPPMSRSVFTILNVLIFFTTISLFLYYMKDIEIGNPYFNLVKNLIMYIPCLFYEFIDWVKEQYRITTPTAFIILGIDILFVVLQQGWEKLRQIYQHNKSGHTLLEGPVYLDRLTYAGTFEDLKSLKGKDFSYHYGISFWLYINPQPPNTSISYTEYCTVFNYGHKPKLLYKADENKLKIQVKINDDDVKNIYLGNDLKLQKWNHFIINYDGGTLDVILNDKLISSSSSIAPYMTLDAVSVGDNNGIHGAIKDVVYFRKPVIK